MEQLNVDEALKVEINFDEPKLPQSVITFRPLVYIDGEFYTCVLGPDLQTGVTGCGQTIDQALADWDNNLQDRIRYHKEEDEVARYIPDTLKASVNKVG
jgi:hypothetical protein